MKNLLLALLVLPLSERAFGQDARKGLEAYGRGDYASAVSEFLPLAQLGHAGAQAVMGEIFRHGKGVRQDHAEALRWLRLAAAQGHAAGQYGLGNLYGHGQGVPQDYLEAARWYRLAAEQGYVDAQLALGLLVLAGQGVAQDFVEAHKWLNLAAARGNTVAMKQRDSMAEAMTVTQVAEAQKLAREWSAAFEKRKTQ